MRRIGKDPKDFISKMSIIDKYTNCWNWKQVNKNRAQGAYYYWMKLYKFNRPYQLSYFIYKGNYDKSYLCISHICHNPACVNPDHLIAETQKENCNRRYENPKDRAYIPPYEFSLVENATNFTLSQLMNKTGIKTKKLKKIIKIKNLKTSKGIKLTENQVKEILKLREEGNKLSYIAALFNITDSMVCRICRGNRRKNIV